LSRIFLAEKLGVEKSKGVLSGDIRYAFRDDNVKVLFGEETVRM
jgi:hypothetical protein